MRKPLPHCHKPLSSALDHSPEGADRDKTSPPPVAQYGRLRRTARLLRRHGLLLSVVVVALAALIRPEYLAFVLYYALLAGLVWVLLGLRKKRFGRITRALIAAFLLFLLALILSPLMFRYHDCDPDGVTRALGDCRNISTAILLFHKDTDTWPIYTSADHIPESRVDYLYGNMGDIPIFNDEARESWGSRSEDMYFTLVKNGRTGPWHQYGRKAEGDYSDYSRPSAGGWAGPYLPYVSDNQQGFAYLVSVSGFEGGTKPDNHVWCLSAGPNFIVETPAWATETHGDDVGYPVTGYSRSWGR